MSNKEIESNNPIVIVLVVLAGVGGYVAGYFSARKRYERKFEGLYKEFREKGELADMASIENIKQVKKAQGIIKQELAKTSNMIKYIKNTDKLDKEKLKQEYQRVKLVLHNLVD